MALPDTLFVRLTRLRRRIRRLLWTYGLSRVVAIVLSAALVAGLADWQFHFDDPGLRLTLLVAIVAAGGWATWRYLASGLTRPHSHIETALQVERRFPRFRDSLASTVQFLEAGTDARLGSLELQQRVIDETIAQFENVNLADVIDARPARRAAATALVVCLVAVLLTAANPPSAGLALKRLALPFSAEVWPRRTNLRLLTDRFEPIEFKSDEPLRGVRGRALEYFVEDANGNIPEDVQLVFQIGNGDPVWEPLRRATLRDAAGETREVFAAKIPTVEGPVRFRVVGGDDDTMPFYELQIVPPPVLEELQVTLTPPAYSELPAEKLSPDVGHIQALVGTRVDVTARVDIPVAEAKLRFADKDPVALSLDTEGTRFRASFVVDAPGISAYGFDLLDRYGFKHEDARYEVRATADLIPQVSIDQPESDINVTVDAEVPLHVTAKDDLRLRDVRLRYQLGESTAAPEAIIPLDVPTGTAGPVQAQHLWKLAELRLTEGLRIIYHAEATDDLLSSTDDMKAGSAHIGRSPARSLTVVSRDEKANEIASRQMTLLEQMAAIRATQQQAREQVGELQLQWNKAGELQPSDVDLLKRIELDQRRIAGRLHDPQEGVSSQAAALLEELQRNHVQNAETAGRLERMVHELTELKESQSAAISQQLTEALKEAENAPSAQPDAKPPMEKQSPEKQPAERQSSAVVRGVASLESARNGQTGVVETLDAMLRELGRWRDHREFAADLGEMIARQKTLNAETSEAAQKTLTKAMPDLTPQEQADLARLADRQGRQAEKFKSFEDELQQAASKPRDAAEGAGQLDAMQKLLKRQATSSKMRETSERLLDNQVGQAMVDQQRILESLQEAEQLLNTRENLDLETRLAQIRKAEQELDALHKQEEQLRNDAEKAAGAKAAPESPNAEQSKSEAEQLKKKQRAARDRADEIGRQLKRLQIRQAEQSLRRAAERMQQVEQNLSESADGNNSEQAARNAQEALDDVEQAQRETAHARRESEQQLAREALERMANSLQGMIARQQSVIDETTRLEAERTRRGNWSRGQLKSLANLADVQHGLKGETDLLAEKVRDAAVFQLALQSASEEMDRAATRLSQRLTDEPTLDAQRQARKRFVDLVAALAQDQSDAAGKEQTEQPGEPEQADGAGAPSDAIALVAQLKLLKTMQEELRQRTSTFDQSRGQARELSDEQQQMLARLAGEQGKLAEIAADMARTILGAGGHETKRKEKLEKAP